MPKIAGREVRGEFLALQLFKIGEPVSPTAINKHVGRGDYAAKYISFLKNRHGFDFTVQKDGRTVLTYTLVSEPANAAEVRGRADVVSKDVQELSANLRKAGLEPIKPKSKKAVKVRQSKQTASAPVKKAARNVLKDAADKQADALLAEIGMKNAGEYAGGTYSVDPDWDSMDGIDVANFLK
jgi:hypothetical protein